MTRRRMLPPADHDQLLAHVHQQREQIDDLRSALQRRAVIEQAKGILIARTGADPQTAFDRLIGHSQRTNVKLVRVAAALVARAVTTSHPVAPAAPSGGDGVQRDEQDVELATVAALRAPDFQELLDTVVYHAGSVGVRAGALALAEPDGALRYVAYTGVDLAGMSAWQRLPPGTETVAHLAAETRSPQWFPDRRQREAQVPGSRSYPAHGEATAALPLQAVDQLIGVLTLEWDAAHDFDAQLRQHLVGVAAMCAAPMAELLGSYDPTLRGLEFEPATSGWFRSFLFAQPGPCLVLRPEHDDRGPVDLIVESVNEPAHEDTGVETGRSVFEHHPEWIDSRLLDAVEAAFEDTANRSSSVLLPMRSDGSNPVAPREVMLLALGSRLVMSWRAVQAST